MQDERNPYQPPPEIPHQMGPNLPQQYWYQQSSPLTFNRPVNGFAVTSMVCGIVGIFLFILFGAISATAVVFGHVALRQIKKTGHKGKGFAITGLATGYPIVAFWVYVAIYWIVVGISNVPGQ